MKLGGSGVPVILIGNRHMQGFNAKAINEVCYDTWYIPNVICNSAYKDCMKDAV
jgi:hypothetical protein